MYSLAHPMLRRPDCCSHSGGPTEKATRSEICRAGGSCKADNVSFPAARHVIRFMQCEKTLAVDSLKDFEEGLLVSSIPKTFQDAVFITTRLSGSCLCIDVLCIVQDFVDDLEWRQEASTMGDIYANSYITCLDHPKKTTWLGFGNRNYCKSFCGKGIRMKKGSLTTQTFTLLQRGHGPLSTAISGKQSLDMTSR